MIRIIAIGKRHESWVREGIERYEKRLKRPFDVEWILLPHSSREGDAARQEESERLLFRIDAHEYVILLDERGEMSRSTEMSRMLLRSLEASRPVTIVIGGAYGTSERMHVRANVILSLSLLVFPHQLVRLLLIEQLYRAQEIAAGRPYHHG